MRTVATRNGKITCLAHERAAGPAGTAAPLAALIEALAPLGMPEVRNESANSYKFLSRICAGCMSFFSRMRRVRRPRRRPVESKQQL